MKLLHSLTIWIWNKIPRPLWVGRLYPGLCNYYHFIRGKRGLKWGKNGLLEEKETNKLYCPKCLITMENLEDWRYVYNQRRERIRRYYRCGKCKMETPFE